MPKMPKKILLGAIALAIIVLAGVSILFVRDETRVAEKEQTAILADVKVIQQVEPAKSIDEHEDNSETDPLTLKDNDFQLAGFALGDPREKILETQGEPLKKTSEFIDEVIDIEINMTFETWVYQDLEIEFWLDDDLKNGWVWAISTSSDKYPTYRGIKVGDTLDDVFLKYGKVFAYEGCYSYIYEVFAIDFKVENNKVIEITIHQFFD